LNGSKVSILDWRQTRRFEKEKKKTRKRDLEADDEKDFEFNKKEMTTEMDRTLEGAKLQDWWVDFEELRSGGR